MVQYSTARLDASFAALADATRRGVLEQLVGRVRTSTLGALALEEELTWLEHHRRLWDSRFDALDEVVEKLKRKRKHNGRQ